MKATLFLRIASALTLIHCILHTVGGVLASPRHGVEEFSVIETMKSHRFDVMGSMRSYWDFFFGYGLFATLGLAVQAILLWQLGQLIRENYLWGRKVAALLFLNYLGMAVISWRYFFIAPAITELLIAACLASALAVEHDSHSKSMIHFSA